LSIFSRAVRPNFTSLAAMFKTPGFEWPERVRLEI